MVCASAPYPRAPGQGAVDNEGELPHTTALAILVISLVDTAAGEKLLPLAIVLAMTKLALEDAAIRVNYLHEALQVAILPIALEHDTILEPVNPEPAGRVAVLYSFTADHCDKCRAKLKKWASGDDSGSGGGKIVEVGK